MMASFAATEKGKFVCGDFLATAGIGMNEITIENDDLLRMTGEIIRYKKLCRKYEACLETIKRKMLEARSHEQLLETSDIYQLICETIKQQELRNERCF